MAAADIQDTPVIPVTYFNVLQQQSIAVIELRDRRSAGDRLVRWCFLHDLEVALYNNGGAMAQFIVCLPVRASPSRSFVSRRLASRKEL